MIIKHSCIVREGKLPKDKLTVVLSDCSEINYSINKNKLHCFGDINKKLLSMGAWLTIEGKYSKLQSTIQYEINNFLQTFQSLNSKLV